MNKQRTQEAIEFLGDCINSGDSCPCPKDSLDILEEVKLALEQRPLWITREEVCNLIEDIRDDNHKEAIQDVEDLFKSKGFKVREK